LGSIELFLRETRCVIHLTLRELLFKFLLGGLSRVRPVRHLALELLAI
jgi:hypothetical protein